VAKLAALSGEDAGNAQPTEKTPAQWAAFWEKELTAARKRLDIFTRQGNGTVARFRNISGATDDQTLSDNPGGNMNSLNLFWSNITTLQSMLYGQEPTIDVSREHHDPDDDIARVACVLYQRILQADVTASGEDFPTALKAALQDRLLPGLGVCRVSYQMATSTTTIAGAPTQQVDFENASVDYVHWQDFIWGWCRTWSEMPWQGFRSYLTKKEAAKRFGAEKARALEYINQTPSGDKEQGVATDGAQRNNVQKAEIWELWNKQDKTVYWWSPGVDLILDAKPDPLQLAGFWPIPRPMTANLTTSLYLPKPDYCLAQDLYNEVDILQIRISNITRACKVVGVYDASEETSVGRMLTEGLENQLIPVQSWAMFGEKGGLEGAIDWFPLQDVVGTLNQLIQVRDQTIGLLHEVTGMSDILRGGNTDQYTSDGTNQLKAKFGSIRVQCLQDEFARFASDLSAMKAEIISKHYRPDSIIRQSSAEYLPEPDKPKVADAIKLMQSPDVKWRVNIRPESIAMIDYAQLKSERTEYLTAMATFIQSANSMVTAVPPEAQPKVLALMFQFMQFGMVGFKGSDYMEGILDQAIDEAKNMPPPKEKDDGKAQADMQKMQMQMQMEMQKIQAKSQADLQLIQAKNQAELQKLQMDGQNDLRAIQAKAQADNQKILTDLQADLKIIATKLNADLQVEQAQSTFAIAEKQTEHANAMQLEAATHADAMAQIEKQADEQEEASGMEEDD
jgi:hypothetical protein